MSHGVRLTSFTVRKRLSNLFSCLLMSIIILSLQSCTTYKTVIRPLKKQTRVGILGFDSFTNSYVFDAVYKSGLIPVSLEETQARKYLLGDNFMANLESHDSILAIQEKIDPMKFKRPVFSIWLQEDLKAQGIDYILMMKAKAIARDREFSAILIDVADMTIVRSAFKRIKIMTPLWIGFTAIGFSPFVMPWFYLENTEDNIHDMIVDFLSEEVD